MDHTALSLLMKDRPAAVSAAHELEYGAPVPMLGTDEKTDSLDADLKHIQSRAVLESLPTQTKPEDDMGRAALMVPTGGKNPDGTAELWGDYLHGPNAESGWQNGPTVHELNSRHEAARRVVLDTASLPPAERANQRMQRLMEAEFGAEHGDLRATNEEIAAAGQQLLRTLHGSGVDVRTIDLNDAGVRRGFLTSVAQTITLSRSPENAGVRHAASQLDERSDESARPVSAERHSNRQATGDTGLLQSISRLASQGGRAADGSRMPARDEPAKEDPQDFLKTLREFQSQTGYF